MEMLYSQVLTGIPPADSGSELSYFNLNEQLDLLTKVKSIKTSAGMQIKISLYFQGQSYQKFFKQVALKLMFFTIASHYVFRFKCFISSYLEHRNFFLVLH
jgi:hypothetical protein